MNNNRKIQGFSLYELMIVLAIIAILAAIAIPSYQGSVQKSRRAEAQSTLLSFAGVAERVYTQNTSYATVALPANSDYYNFSFPVAVTAQAWTIRATPQGAQSADKCGTMNLTHTGIRSHSGSASGCWNP